VACDFAFAPSDDQAVEKALRVRYGHGGQLGNRAFTPDKGPGDGVKAFAMATGAGNCIAFVPGVPGGFFAGLLGVEACQWQACAEAAVAPAMLGVVAEHARIRLGETCAATRAGALDRKMPLFGAG